MTDDQFWRLVITSAFVSLLSMAMPALKSWLSARSRGGKPKTKSGAIVSDKLSERAGDRGTTHE